MADNTAKYAAIATAAAAAAAIIAIRARRGTAEAIQAAAGRAAQDAAQGKAEELDDTPLVPERADQSLVTMGVVTLIRNVLARRQPVPQPRRRRGAEV